MNRYEYNQTDRVEVSGNFYFGFFETRVVRLALVFLRRFAHNFSQTVDAMDLLSPRSSRIRGSIFILYTREQTPLRSEACDDVPVSI